MSTISQRVNLQLKRWYLFSAVACLVISASVVLASCHTMIPLSYDEGGYAPAIEPPLRQPVPGIGTSVGYLAPEFMLTDVTGNKVSLSNYRGRPVMLNFWTYCDLCKEELPYIQAVYDNRGSIDPDLEIIAVNVSQPAEQVIEFAGYHKFTFVFLIDTWASVASDYYIHEIPTTFMIDRNGIIQDIHVGILKSPEIIRRKLAELCKR